MIQRNPEQKKLELIRSWKKGLDDRPDDVILMDDDAWYSSLVGLTMRLMLNGCITSSEADRELAIN